MSLLRDIFWIACLLVITGTISVSGLRYSTSWNEVEIGPIPPAAPAAAMQDEDDPQAAPDTEPQNPLALAQLKD
ncbi:MAG: hypothetical protein GVY24_02445 [Planctomycetes bacterium]|jgi:hypothetical protein|nr:hypothetical protein [Planctomycetota bacterium]